MCVCVGCVCVCGGGGGGGGGGSLMPQLYFAAETHTFSCGIVYLSPTERVVS